MCKALLFEIIKYYVKFQNTMPNFIPRGFPKEMWIIFAGDVITSLGMSMVFIFLSVYFNVVLGISMAIIGMMWMVTNISSFFSQLVGGALADHFGRKRLMEISLLLRGLIWVGIAFIDNTLLLASMIVVTGMLASLFWPASSAMVTDIIAPERRVEAFGLWRIGGNLGWGLGAMIGGILASISFKLVFIVGGISNIAFGIMVIILLTETLPKKSTTEEMQSRSRSVIKNVYEYKSVLKDKRFFFFTLVGVLVAFMYSQSNTTMPVFAVSDAMINTKQLGYIWALNAWSVVTLQMIVARYIERFNLIKMMAFGSCIYASSFLILARATGFWGIMAFMAVFTAGELIISPLEMAFVANSAPEDKRGRYMGFYSLTWGMGGATGPFAGGVILDTMPSRYLWYIISGVGMLAAGGYLAIEKLINGSNKENA